MATVHRTFVNRGKREITDIKPGYIYAIEYTLDAENARTLGIRTEQVGLIYVGHSGQILRNYNISKLNDWAVGGIDLKNKHVWYASEMEIAFVKEHLEHEDLLLIHGTAKKLIAEYTNRLRHYRHHPLHRFAENIISIWNDIKAKFHEQQGR